jgi:hypothetical protein
MKIPYHDQSQTLNKNKKPAFLRFISIGGDKSTRGHTPNAPIPFFNVDTMISHKP